MENGKWKIKNYFNKNNSETVHTKNVSNTIFRLPSSIFNYFACLFTFLFLISHVFAYEDCILTTNGKMTEISIQHNDIVDIFPLITVMNDKNTLIIHPLKEGSTKFSIIKDGKDKYFFDVIVTEDSTKISPKDGFDILNIDCPPISYEYYFDLDIPPYEGGEIIDIDEPPYSSDNTELYNLDEPPKLRGE